MFNFRGESSLPRLESSIAKRALAQLMIPFLKYPDLGLEVVLEMTQTNKEIYSKAISIH